MYQKTEEEGAGLVLFKVKSVKLLAQFIATCSTLPLTLESLLSSDMLDEESGLPGGEESTCKGPSSSILTSDGVCKGAA